MTLNMNPSEQAVSQSILDAMEKVSNNMPDGRYKSMVFTKLEEAFALSMVEKVKQQFK